MQNNTQKQLEFPTVMGQPYEKLPDDLFIPPNALEFTVVVSSWTPSVQIDKSGRHTSSLEGGWECILRILARGFPTRLRIFIIHKQI